MKCTMPFWLFKRDNSETAGTRSDGEVMAKRILVPVERTDAMEFTLRVVRLLATEGGDMVRLLAILPIPEPLRDVRDSIILTTDQQIERLAVSTAETLRRLATTHLDGVPVETSVIFGDRAVEIGLEAECFGADLVVMPRTPRRSPVSWVTRLTRGLLSGRADLEIALRPVANVAQRGREGLLRGKDQKYPGICTTLTAHCR